MCLGVAINTYDDRLNLINANSQLRSANAGLQTNLQKEQIRVRNLQQQLDSTPKLIVRSETIPPDNSNGLTFPSIAKLGA